MHQSIRAQTTNCIVQTPRSDDADVDINAVRRPAYYTARCWGASAALANDQLDDLRRAASRAEHGGSCCIRCDHCSMYFVQIHRRMSPFQPHLGLWTHTASPGNHGWVGTQSSGSGRPSQPPQQRRRQLLMSAASLAAATGLAGCSGGALAKTVTQLLADSSLEASREHLEGR